MVMLRVESMHISYNTIMSVYVPLLGIALMQLYMLHAWHVYAACMDYEDTCVVNLPLPSGSRSASSAPMPYHVYMYVCMYVCTLSDLYVCAACLTCAVTDVASLEK
jgi:hypothetical protein